MAVVENSQSNAIMLFNVVDSANSQARNFPAHPTDPNGHNRLDGYGGSGIPGCRMDGPQPRCRFSLLRFFLNSGAGA
jgi:hypothetical protein